MSWEEFNNIKGPKGDKGPAGTISSVSSATVPPGTSARATITGTEDVHLHLELPQGERGEQGPPGVASSASAKSVGPEEPAKAIIEQHGEAVHVSFEIPKGLPGTNGVATAEAIGTNLAAPDSPARPGLETGMEQVANDPASGFAQSQQAKLDAGLGGKANLVGGRVPDSELGVSETATSGTIPRRSAGGRLAGIGSPTAATDAANRKYVDDATQVARDIASVSVTCTYKKATYGGKPIWYSVVRAHTNGRFVPGLVRKAFASDHDKAGTSGASFKPQRENLKVVEARHAPTVIGNAGGWHLSGNTDEIRGAQIKDGVIYHEVENTPTGSDALGFLADGSTRWYSNYTNGDTAASMLADGVIDCFSFGPCVVRSGVKLNLDADTWWGATWRTEISGRQILGQSSTGDIVLITVEGVTNSYGIGGNDIAAIAFDEGCYNAIALDGGGSAQTRMAGQIVTPSTDAGVVRPVPDFVLIGGRAANEPDTGWQAVEPASGVEVNAKIPKVRRLGSRVIGTGGFGSGLTVSTTTRVGDLPMGGFAPADWRYLAPLGTSHVDRGAAPVVKQAWIEMRVGAQAPTYAMLDAMTYEID